MKIYFKNLDGLRFIAAFLVILDHAQFFKSINHEPLSSYFSLYLAHTGEMGVNLFFVLSGFLISFLLMSEHKITGTVNLGKFYIRRILRIWPLYFAYGLGIILLSGVFFRAVGMIEPVSFGDTITNIIFLIFFAVNIQFITIGHNPGMVEILWSVCVEEQFYLIWPLIIKKFRGKIKRVIVILLVVGLGSKLALSIATHFSFITPEYKLLFNYVMLPNKVELFAAGMAGAYLYFHKEKFANLFRIIQSKSIQFGVIAVALLFTFTNFYLKGSASFYLSDYLACLIYGSVVLIAIQPSSILNFEFPWLRTLGRISYGIYLFHPPICHLTLFLMTKKLHISNSFLSYDIIYPLSATLFTCILAYISYQWFEKAFLKRKNKFAIVKTRI